jgi:hypothetical protein
MKLHCYKTSIAPLFMVWCLSTMTITTFLKTHTFVTRNLWRHMVNTICALILKQDKLHITNKVADMFRVGITLTNEFYRNVN